MDNDQRVQQLEQELQLLKAQIQSTLLDIQEQLLSNKYPTLRLDENKRLESDTAHGWKAPYPTPDTLPEMDPFEVVQPVVVQPIQRIQPIQPLQPDESEQYGQYAQMGQQEPYGQRAQQEPQGQRAQQEQYGQRAQPGQTGRFSAIPSVVRVEVPPPPAAHAAPPVDPQSGKPSLELPSRPLLTNEDWVALSRIAKWMSSKSAELGPQRMRALIKMYAQKQQLAPDVMENLLQFLALYGDEGVQVMSTIAGANTNGNGNSPKVSQLFGADALDLDAALGMDAPPTVGMGRRNHGHNTHA